MMVEFIHHLDYPALGDNQFFKGYNPLILTSWDIHLWATYLEDSASYSYLDLFLVGDFLRNCTICPNHHQTTMWENMFVTFFSKHRTSKSNCLYKIFYPIDIEYVWTPITYLKHQTSGGMTGRFWMYRAKDPYDSPTRIYWDS